MDEMARLAGIYWRVGAPELKTQVENFFQSMDRNRDGKVSLPEYLDFMAKNYYGPLRDPQWFRDLCKPDKRILRSEDVRPLYYMLSSGRPFCIGCGKLVTRVYFTCVECFEQCPTSFSACLKCYESNNIAHEHDAFLDNFAMLEAKRTKSRIPALRATAARNPAKDQTELHQIAMAYCRSALTDENERTKINNFLNSFNLGSRRLVSLHELVDFMNKKAYKKIFGDKNISKLFAALSRNKRDLDSDDVKTLYYIMQSGRPFCGGCTNFITGTFFTCVECFGKRRSSCFYLCGYCYNDRRFTHIPEHQLFLDNYALLEAVRVSNKASKTIAPLDAARALWNGEINLTNDSFKAVVTFIREASATATATATIISIFAPACVIM